MTYTIKLTQCNQIKEVAIMTEFLEAKKFVDSSKLDYSMHWTKIGGIRKSYTKAQ